MVSYIFQFIPDVQSTNKMNNATSSRRSENLYADAFVWDAHAGVFPDPAIDLTLLKSWRGRGVDYLSINVGFDVMDWQQTLKTLAAYRHWLLTQAGDFVLVDTLEDIEHAKQNGKLAVSFDIEGMNALNGDINMLSLYHALGVRQMLFAYNLNNEAAGGCHDTNIGLTDFGRAILREMNRLGIIVDCSHASLNTTLDIMAESSNPVVFSHSNPNSVWEHQRNILDHQIIGCAQTGGVIGLNGMGIFLGENDIRTETLLKHIGYVADLVGPEHLGIGFDYTPDVEVDIGVILNSRPDYWPAGQRYDTPEIKHAGPSRLPAIVDGLIGYGFNDVEIRGFLGENFRRVASQTWAAP
jgi:membrane dipeptidase